MYDLKLCELKQVILEDSHVEILLLKTTEGEVGIMTGHEPMVMELTVGPHKLRSDGKEKYFYCLKGMASVNKEGVQIYSVKCLVSDQLIENYEERMALKIVEQKEYDYDNLKKNIIKEFSQKVLREDKQL